MATLFCRTKTSHSVTNSKARSVQPVLEILEDRTVPAVAQEFSDGRNEGASVEAGVGGWHFRVNSNITVTKLGCHDWGGDGLRASHPVGVWDMTGGGTLLAQVTVSAGTAAPLEGHFRYVTLATTLPLTPGRTYAIGWYSAAETDEHASAYHAGSGLTIDPRIQVVGAAYATQHGVFVPPNFVSSTIPGWGYFGPNFQFETATDLAATKLEWNTAQGGVDLSGKITGAPLPQDTTLQLYWASGTTTDTILKSATAAIRIPKTIPVNQEQTLHLAPSDFVNAPPPDAKYLLAVLDPDNKIDEGSDGEKNNVLALHVLPNITPASLTWNTVQAGVDFGYKVSGAALTQDTTAALYWSSSDKFADAIGGPVYSTPIEHPVGDYGPFYVPNAVLGTPPPGATHLLLVTDPPDATHPKGLIEETDETNNVKALRLFEIEMLSATTDDSQSIRYDYEIKWSPIDHFQVNFYRSADDQFDPGDDVFLGADTIDGALPGPHTRTAPIATPIDPDHPYVLAVADRHQQVSELDEDNNVASFRKRVLGVVTHGFNLLGWTRFGFSAWITDMAASLKNEAGYDRTVAFDWDATSFLPVPGMTERAGVNMAGRVAREIRQLTALYPDDIIDVHFIGHSRGAVVISQALMRLEANPDVNQGFTKMTMLDPHPAKNYPDEHYSVVNIPLPIPEELRRIVAPPLRRLFGVIGAIDELGAWAERALILFQAATNDPDVVVPPNVDLAEVYYQRTPWFLASPGLETILNLWGDVPIRNESPNEPQFHDLTAAGMSHTSVHAWYQQNVVGTLGGGTSPFTAPLASDSAGTPTAAALHPVMAPATDRRSRSPAKARAIQSAQQAALISTLLDPDADGTERALSQSRRKKKG